MKKNIAVVGFGFMGMTHTLNILNNPDLKLTAIVDKNPDVIRKNLSQQSGNFSTGKINAEELSSVNIYKGLSDCLKAEKLDAVVIAVHTSLHYTLTKVALEAGVNVFLEKPICLDLSEGRKLISLSKEQNLILMIGQVVRFMPAYLTLKNWIENGTYGKLKFLSLSRFSGLPAWGEWKDKQDDFGSSGGALFDLVIHDIDFAQWVCGKPDTVEAVSLPGKLSRNDYVCAFWKYDFIDLQVKIEGGNTYHSSYPFQASFNAVFEKSSVLFSPKDPANIIVANDTHTSLIPVSDNMTGFSSELDYFTNCLVNNQPPLRCTPDSALETIEICYKHINLE